MLDAFGRARIGQHFGQRARQAEAPVGLTQERDAAIAGHLPASETGLDGALFYDWPLFPQPA